MRRREIIIGLGLAVAVLAATWGCRTTGSAAYRSPSHRGAGPRAVSQRMKRTTGLPLRRLVCLYDQRPWLNLDKAGDRDPEGIRYKVFLVAKGGDRGELRNGTFNIEMYRIRHNADGQLRRELVSDWHYPSTDVPVIAQPGMLGDGYNLYLRWSSKSLAGSEIEIITMFEEPDGNTVRSGTKRLRVPKYTS